MKSFNTQGILFFAILFWFSPLNAACLCGPGVPCDLFLSEPITEDTDFIACENVVLQSGFVVDPTVDASIAAGLEVSFEGNTGVDQTGSISVSIFSELACEGDADFDLFNQCLDCDDNRDDVNPDAPEICDSLDNDCNPATSDGIDDPAVGEPCDGPDSDFCQEGVISCSAGSLSCSDDTFDDVEVCDLVDNDCDGQVDGPEACPCGVDPISVYDDRCPTECTGGCQTDRQNGETCIIACIGKEECRYDDIVCPPGMNCSIVCVEDSSCRDGTITCPGDYACDIDCTGVGQTCMNTDIHCSTDGTCNLRCSDDNCKDVKLFCGNDTCSTDCNEMLSYPEVICGSSCNCDVSSCSE